MTKEDLPGVYLVEKDAFPIPWSIQSFEEELTNMFATYLVAKQESEIVGYLGMWFILDECHITNIAVLKEYRKLGIASDLIQKMFALCKEHQTTYITLEVRTNNIPAQSLYQKFGFEPEAIRKDYYKNPDGTREDALIMSKNIK